MAEKINSISIETMYLNSVTFKINCSHTGADKELLEYSINGGAWRDYIQADDYGMSWVTKNGKLVRTRLFCFKPNTTYKIRFRITIFTSTGYDMPISPTLTFKVFDYPKLTSAPAVNIGQVQTVKNSTPVSSYKYSLYLEQTNGTLIRSFGIITGTSRNLTIDANTLYRLTPNSNTLNARYTLITTQNNDTYTSTLNTSFKVTNSNPTFNNYTFKDNNSVVAAITGDNQVFVKGLSNLNVEVSSANKMAAINYATANRYEINVDSLTKSLSYSTSTINTDVGAPTIAGSRRLSVKAIDSRGNIKEVVKTITVIDYFNPVFRPNIQRTNSFESETKIAINVQYAKVVVNSENKNNISQLSYRYKERNGSYNAWKTISFSDDANAGTIDSEFYLTLDNSKSFIFEFRATDKFKTVTSTEVLLTEGIPAFFISSNKKCIGVNCIPPDDAVEGGIYSNGKDILKSEVELATSNFISPILPYTTGNVIYIQKTGNVVTVLGTGKANNYSTISSNDEVLGGRIPQKYAPLRKFYTVIHGSGKDKMLMAINDNGEITFSRYSATSGTNVWIPFYVTYITNGE